MRAKQSPGEIGTSHVHSSARAPAPTFAHALIHTYSLSHTRVKILANPQAAHTKTPDLSMSLLLALPHIF